jgi:quinol monooxygenase YgiN
MRSVSTENPNEIFLYERYTTREDLEVVHAQSQAFKTFFLAVSAEGLITSREQWTCHESGVGYITK